MRFVITGELSRNTLLQVIVGLYLVYVAALWLTNALLYFDRMGLDYTSVVEYHLGSEERYLEPRSYRGLLEISHFHLFAMGLLLMVLTHLMLFVPVSNRVKLWLIVTPFVAALVDEGASWLIRFAHPGFAYAKIAGFAALELSLAALIGVGLWSILRGSAEAYTSGEPEPPEDLEP